MGCCQSTELTPMMVSMEDIQESTKFIPMQQLVKDYNVHVNMMLDNAFEFKQDKQIQIHEEVIIRQPYFDRFEKSMIQAVVETLLTEWHPKVLASWGIIFEYRYKPIWTLQVPSSQKNMARSLVMIIDLDNIQGCIFYPSKLCC